MTPASVLILLEVVEGFVFFLDPFRAAIASGLVTVHLRTFLRAVAEACSPQRFREENALVRFISLSLAWRHVYICIRLYHGECDFSNPARGPTDLPE